MYGITQGPPLKEGGLVWPAAAAKGRYMAVTFGQALVCGSESPQFCNGKFASETAVCTPGAGNKTTA
jgi:hypothetical protein